MTLRFFSDYDLQPSNSLAVPSFCKWFASVEERSQLIEVAEFADKNELRLIVLGAGTNVILEDYLDALVVRINLCGRNLFQSDDAGQQVDVAAGEDWHDFVQWSLARNFYGLENLALIPGTCGAAPIQNIGAYGVELSDVLDSVEIFDLESREIRRLDSTECEFGYRESIFKRELRDRAIVLSMRLNLGQSTPVNANYPVLKEFLQLHRLEQTPENIFRAVCEIRQSKLPDPKEIPNAGSFFKNPVIQREKLQELLRENPEIPFFEVSEHEVKVPAAWLIDRVGLKGETGNGVGIHEKQALVIINPGKQTSAKILDLAAIIQDQIQETFGISLELEPRVVRS